jgi:hypothetical protein
MHEMSDDKICAAYVAAFAEIEAATKSASNLHFKSKYADLPAVVDAIKPHLAKHGLGFMQCPRPADGGVAIETILIHAGGEKMSMGLLFVPANKHDAHGFGSALTYARRYALQTCFGLPTEDDDGQAAVKSVNTKPQAAAPIITEAQFKVLQDLIDRTGVNAAEMASHYKVKAISQLPAARFESAKKSLEARLSNA